MGPLNLALWAAGIALIVVGYLRGRGPWSRYQALRAQEANLGRYEAWRGGLRDQSKSGASVAMEMFRRAALVWVAVAALGVLLVLAGFAVR